MAAAHKLISLHGFDGVTIRELAAESGVTPKTLYHHFGSKDRLLQIAVEERFRHLYQAIEEADIERGVDRLFYILDTIANLTAKNRAYAKALAPLLQRGEYSSLSEVRRASYLRAIRQIDQESELVDWLSPELVADIIYRQVTMTHVKWFQRETPRNLTFSMLKLEVSLILRSISTGYTFERTTEVIEGVREFMRMGR
ncbi:MAG: helix-turn-helix domain-containing protein [Pseudomonadales bacterium]